MTHASSRCPATGSAPRSWPPRWRCSSGSATSSYDEQPFGGASIDAHGTALTDEVLAACRAADAVLLGRRRRPEVGHHRPDAPRPEQGLLGLRKGLGLFANLRPVRPIPALSTPSPLRRELSRGPTCSSCASSPAGSTSATRARAGDSAYDPCIYSVERSSGSPASRSSAAPSRVTSVDKANVLETSRLWREVVTRVASDEFPDVELEHLLVDNAAMQLVPPRATST